MISEAALFFTAAAVGILHMSAPDHWATLLVLGRVAKWGRSKLLGVGVITAVGHVGFSLALGFVIVGLGFAFSARISTGLTIAVGAVMVVGGLAYGARELKKRTPEDYEMKTLDELTKAEGKYGRRFRYFAVLGAALSPDLAILPVLFLAIRVGLGFTLAIAAVFGAASVVALLLFLLLGMTGLGKILERIPPEYNDAIVGFVIAAVGLYVVVAG